MSIVSKQPRGTITQDNIELLEYNNNDDGRNSMEVNQNGDDEDDEVIPWVSESYVQEKAALVPNLEHLDELSYLQVTQNIKKDCKSHSFFSIFNII